MKTISELCPGVSPTGDSLRYEVRSATRPGAVHTVDLSAWSGHGECTCERWQYHYAKLVREGVLQLSQETACRHLVLVWRYFALQQAQAVIAYRLAQVNQLRAAAGKPPIHEENESTPY